MDVRDKSDVSSFAPPKPERKRKKLKLVIREAATDDIAKLRQSICEHKNRCQDELKEVYRDNLAELFFLQNGTNFVDIQSIKKRPNFALRKYLQSYEFESETDEPPVKVKVEPNASSAGEVDAKQPVVASPPRSLPSHGEAAIAPADSDTGTPVESIMEQAKKEASVMQRVAELRKKGLWSAKRLPKVQEAARPKAHWDYLLEEMQWLATDFAQERKWKKAGCRKISRMIIRYHQDRVGDEKRAEKEEGFRLRRIAGQLAKQIKDFWSNIEKVVQYKHDSRLDEKRRRAMDLQLNFIVDQTEKYSSWLSAGLTTAADASSCHEASSHSPSSVGAQDKEFEPNGDSDDDEETIAKEEALTGSEEDDTNAELAALQADSEMPLDELIASLPPEVLDKPAAIDDASTSEQISSDEYDGDCSEAVDDEHTLIEQEKHETQSDQEELDDLKNEGEMSVEELAAKYAGAYASDFELPETPSSTEVDTDDGEDEDQQTSSDDEPEELSPEPMEEIGMEYLLHPEKDKTDMLSDQEHRGSPNREITDIAAAAQSLQPTGYTLETTEVKTPIPFLLKHTLREYQHVGLDWLATMYERKLNGILADEMGLGKTIQTIALLAHLACEHEIWGPHLVVVPTSVMLNWEMELKKWCPGFKILTYYGSPKERKLKRVGWTKTNAFHVCITSYKLVIQDHLAFRRKKWKYLILDEAQNIKNFKSQRWQTLLNFNSQRRLLLTGTPLQNNLMELWSLMHFLMPHVFQSHMDFKEWFANPLTGMIEGTNEYNDKLIRRLHKVLRPFLLRRLKADVERQLPKKYEHVVMCRLSKRQRYLYEEFMSRRATKETLEGGHFMSVINILMQLRKVCNHPDLFDPRPITSPFETESVSLNVATAVLKALEYEPLKHLNLFSLCPNLADLDMNQTAYAAHRCSQLQTPKRLIEAIDEEPEPPPRPPPTKLRPFVLRSSTASQAKTSGSLGTSQSGRTISITSSVMKPSVGPQLGSLIAQRPSTPAGTPSTTQPITLQIQHSLQSSAAKSHSGISSAGVIKVIQTSSGQIIPSSNAHTVTVASTSVGKTQVPSGAVTSQLKVVSGTSTKPSAASTVVNGTKSVALKSVTSSGVKAGALLLGPASRKRALQAEARSKFVAELSISSIQQREVEWRAGLLSRIAFLNKRNCCHRPVYGLDLHSVVDVWTRALHSKPARFESNSVAHCYNASRLMNPNHPRYYWQSTSFLQKAILSATQRLEQLKDVLERYVFLTPPVKSCGVTLHGLTQASVITYEHLLDHVTQRKLRECSLLLHPVHTRMLVQFPEKRLIQYDCGKLQTLDVLLRDLKSGKHRVLIFTQMTKMLDVLESFLNYHGHRYLRLDGTTRVEMRQQLMDRFNADDKIFVFILSTRSGGIGVNLTGADTVIFYDSDWNPTMDAQAQDRCHRIGQTRDVHIYRLVSEKTVEENILKKANQKRMLGDVAIEGGNFTTASLQQGTITDLFAEPSGLTSLVEVKRSRQVNASPAIPAPLPAHSVSANLNDKQFEQALCQAEDAEDVQAAVVASEEAGAELAEFDETIPWDEREADLKQHQTEQTSKVELEIASLEKELTPIERFAVTFLEQTGEQFSEEAVKEAEMDIEQAKKDWELGRLKSKKEEEERRAELEEDDMLYTYSKEDGMNQVFKDVITGENMPMWCPPTPPHSENDVYVDQSMCFLYDSAVMTESQLPPVYVKKEKKRRHDSQQHHGIAKKKTKLVAEETTQVQPGVTNRPPRSLFDRPQLLKLRRDKNPLRHGVTGPLSMKMGASGNLQRPNSSDSSHQDQPEWLIHEDWSLLQAVQTLLQLPLNLVVTSPAHIPNWDLVSEIVSTTSRIYRSAKQCRARYETVIIPREEGKLTFDLNPRKPSKKIPKSVYKSKGNKPMRTGQLYTQDSGSSVTTLHAFRFDCIKNVASKRTPTLRPTLVNPTLKNPKHAAVIADNGIQYDSPMNPEEVAKIRQERIKNEKTKAEQQRTVPAQSTVRAQSNVQLQQFSTSGATAIINPATKQALQGATMSAVSIGRNNSIVVSNSLSALGRKLPNQATSVISGVTQVSHTGASRKMTVQEIAQLRSSSTSVAQFMKQVQAGGGSVTGVSQTGAQRTITVQQGQQPISIGTATKQPQFSQFNISSQTPSKQRATGTLVAQRAPSSATQFLSGQQLQSGDTRVPTLVKTVSSGGSATTTNMTIPVSTGVNINVTLPQQQKTLGAISKAGLTGNPPHQFRQIQLLHNKQVTRPQLQKLSLTHPQLVGKSGASVQIVQQRIGKQIGVQQIHQLIKQQQAQQQAQQHAQIITTPGSSGATVTASGGQTIIATSQLITPNMHATITKMSAPNSSSAISGAVNNVTVSLARPVITSSNQLAIVPGSVGSSLVTQSPSKLVSTGTGGAPRPTAHRVSSLQGVVGGSSASVVNLGSVTVQGLQHQQSTGSIVGHRSIPVGAVSTLHQTNISQTAVRAPTLVTNPVSSASATTVLHQTILSNKPAGSSAHPTVSAMSVVQTVSTSTPSIVAQSVAPTVVVPVDPQLVTLADVGSTVTIGTTPTADHSSTTAGSPDHGVRTASPDHDLSDLQASAPDSTKTYAMRPRKTT